MVRGTSITGTETRWLRWAVILLIVAVLLPALGLSWMLARVVENERLATRQKLLAAYQRSLEDLADGLGRTWSGTADGWVAYNLESGQLVYPVLSEPRTEPPGLGPGERHVARLEFVLGDLNAARNEYERLAKTAEDPAARMRARMGEIRCARKMGAAAEADRLTQVFLNKAPAPTTPAEARDFFNARYAMLQSMAGRGAPGLAAELARMLERVADDTLLPDFMPVDTRIALSARVIDCAERQGADVDAARAALGRTQLGAQVARANPTAPRARGRLIPLKGDAPVYGVVEERDGRAWMGLSLASNAVGHIEAECADAFPWIETVRVMDPFGRMAGNGKGEELTRIALSGVFSGWTVIAMAPSEGVLAAAERSRIALYGWIGSLLILLFIACGAAAVVLVGRQVRLNRMKNDFIATVSHELKTPLASTRVMMDTLLEGHYEMADEVRDYLGMISSDNLRLTRLIDGFLTYSRMERNKHAFDITATPVPAVVAAAVNTMHARLEEGCRFELEMPESLPPVLADADAVVLVLINLLDNAWKYSAEPRHIALRIAANDRDLIFEVQDNGIGMTPRTVRRIFDTFYQVDQRLVRTIDGCGLGLSIVKYIVDAHQGSIRVESRPDQGSTFSVQIPRAE